MQSDARPIDRLLAIMAALRHPETGCPWDVKQDFASIAPYTIEEAYEVADAIERGDIEDLRDELGDLLLQVVFHARMAEEQGEFGFEDVATAISEKMVRRHPHIFATADADTPDAVKVRWEEIKAEEKAERRARRSARGLSDVHGHLAGVPRGFPGLLQALKLQAKAADIGFDWPDAAGALQKLHEEIGEIEQELGGENCDPDRLEEEIGDALFSLVNLARKLKVEPDKALRRTNEKFRSRFAAIEDGLNAAGTTLGEASLEEMEALWQAAKPRRPAD
ncbi:nucleoside triphosphate pyrophosphohydrolase [Afifella sp. IM 167]|uniref:nucleoside triphosphate pyrophosphohydrolase n=1 Tax=Afifella sp. IM 167 TaxID=2033586 RepID=UPI001CCD9AEB|nr:nucleoside triphosphate pyrophosphohydrolase [Afifella sp. IM 167]MBZ8132522.1 nucleoside triphosphate pyrophosphohydrolase [Afifella sp. IM 167]